MEYEDISKYEDVNMVIKSGEKKSYLEEESTFRLLSIEANWLSEELFHAGELRKENRKELEVILKMVVVRAERIKELIKRLGGKWA